MRKVVEVQFTSQSKSVTAQTSVTLEDENVNSDEILEEAKNLFDKAERFALNKTFERNK